MYKNIDLTKLTEYCKFHETDTILIGIYEDFSNTADCVWVSGLIVQDAQPHVSSVWGTPVIYNETTNEFVECWKESNMYASWDNTVVRLLTFAKGYDVSL